MTLTSSHLPTTPERNQSKPKSFTLTELLERTYHTPPAIIDDLLYTGTYIFAGSPKIGKSIFAFQLAYHVGSGIPLWNHNVHQGTVLYMALEDTKPRLQHRAFQMFGVGGCDHLTMITEAPTLDNGLEAYLAAFVAEKPDTRLVIIDTLQKIWPANSSKVYSYASDYAVITRLKTFADAHNICLILVHHTRKQAADDAFDMISGTNGIFGCADGALVMQKNQRTSGTATLEITGRDQADQRLHLVNDSAQLIWKLDHAEADPWHPPTDPILERINQLVKTV